MKPLCYEVKVREQPSTLTKFQSVTRPYPLISKQLQSQWPVPSFGISCSLNFLHVCVWKNPALPSIVIVCFALSINERNSELLVIRNWLWCQCNNTVKTWKNLSWKSELLRLKVTYSLLLALQVPKPPLKIAFCLKGGVLDLGEILDFTLTPASLLK